MRDENKKAMLFTLNEHSQYLLSKAIKRTKSKTVDRALSPGRRVSMSKLMSCLKELCQLTLGLYGFTLIERHTTCSLIH
jgi:hypothetical protein